MKKTLKELATELGYQNALVQDKWLMLDERFMVMEDEKGLHLSDAMSWAAFNPIKIGRKSSVTQKGLEFQIAQLRLYKKQRNLV